MIYYISFYQLGYGVTETEIEQMVRQTRSQLLKISEALSVKSGKNYDENSSWAFFFSIEVDSSTKLKTLQADANYLKFLETIIKPRATEVFTQTFILDPSKDRKYS